MFCWEPEGCYHHWLCTAIAPFWFPTKHLSLNTVNAILAVSWWYGVLTRTSPKLLKPLRTLYCVLIHIAIKELMPVEHKKRRQSLAKMAAITYPITAWGYLISNVNCVLLSLYRIPFQVWLIVQMMDDAGRIFKGSANFIATFDVSYIT